MITRAVFLLLEFILIYALYYSYALFASSEIPLHILTVALIATDRFVEKIRQALAPASGD